MSKYEIIRTKLYNEFDNFIADEGIKIDLDRNIENNTLAVTLGDAMQEPLKLGEGYRAYGTKGEIEVFTYFEFQVKSNINPDTLMFEWIDKLEKKVNQIEQSTHTATDYTLTLHNIYIEAIRPRYNEDGKNYLITEIKVNYEQIWS